MYILKRYGESRKDTCPFCEKHGTTLNEQGIPTCSDHKGRSLELKCVCGQWLDIKKGKWGAYAQCIRCGNMNLKKALEMHVPEKPAEEKKDPTKPHVPTEITVRSDEVDFL